MEPSLYELKTILLEQIGLVDAKSRKLAESRNLLTDLLKSFEGSAH